MGSTETEGRYCLFYPFPLHGANPCCELPMGLQLRPIPTYTLENSKGGDSVTAASPPIFLHAYAKTLLRADLIRNPAQRRDSPQDAEPSSGFREHG
jgi:hypothetical protein